MKKKYKIQIFITILIAGFIWGMLGTYIVMNNEDNIAIAAIIAFVLYFISLAIPVRMISNKARKDLPTA
jgi:ABC-type antimicrobial peptide transport system permease subunit